MNGYLIAIANACTLIALNYIALKLRSRLESWEPVAVPILTGTASILMMLLPLPGGFMLLDFRYAPLIMAGWRFGFGLSLLSTLPPMAYVLWAHSPHPLFGIVHGIVLPAIIGSLFHKPEYRIDQATLRLRDGLLIGAILFLLQLTTGYWMSPSASSPFSFWLAGNAVWLGLSCVAIAILTLMVNDESESLLAQRKLEMLANQDGLTRLPNLRSFMQIAHSTIRKQRIAILMIDIDNFKQFNDRHGHLQGDRLLREVGQMLRNLIRDQDYVARYGGEEFIAMCLTNDPRQLAQIAGRLCRTIAEHGVVREGPIDERERVTISIGIAVARHPGDELIQLIAEADRALYDSKHTGKNKFTFYHDEEEPAEAKA